MKFNPKDLLVLLFFVFISELTGIIGSIFTFPAINSWYALLEKPFFAPPNWIFGPAWILLYLIMGTAAAIVCQKGIEKKIVKNALSAFIIQLVLNLLWSVLFFGLKNPLMAFLGIIALWLSIALTITRFASVEKKAAYLMIPYILWVSFAAALNLSIWLLN